MPICSFTQQKCTVYTQTDDSNIKLFFTSTQLLKFKVDSNNTKKEKSIFKSSLALMMAEITPDLTLLKNVSIR